SYKAAFLAVMRRLHDAGVEEINGHLLYAIPDEEAAAADAWLERAGLLPALRSAADAHREGYPEETLDRAADAFLAAWEAEAGLKTLAEAVAEKMAFLHDEGAELPMSLAEWAAASALTPWSTTLSMARHMGIAVTWDAERAKSPEGYYQVRGGIGYAIAKSLAAAPYADLLWMETKTADLADAREFAHAIHAQYPDKMLAYNLSPSFNWDTTGMSDEEMRSFPDELGRMGFVFNFITYGGHQIDGLAAEEFTTALREDGMLALARLQRKLRLVESPYRTPQTLVGGPRADAALLATSGLTATTKAMGAGSTQHQHLVQTEVPPKVLAGWLATWAAHNGLDHEPQVSLRPYSAGSEVLQLAVSGAEGQRLAEIVFSTINDRRGRTILSVRDQRTDPTLRRRRLMTLLHLFLIHRYGAAAVHYLTPTDDNRHQAERMRALGIFEAVADEVGEIIVAEVATPTVRELVAGDGAALERLMNKGNRPPPSENSSASVHLKD
ncbi:MAG TPA: isocitrate lyase, partial [Candidatus Limnocylindria bacterium]|nr:isocitrate lyase [Candidatus Limnocylindria bacterium]